MHDPLQVVIERHGHLLGERDEVTLERLDSEFDIRRHQRIAPRRLILLGLGKDDRLLERDVRLPVLE